MVSKGDEIAIPLNYPTATSRVHLCRAPVGFGFLTSIFLTGRTKLELTVCLSRRVLQMLTPWIPRNDGSRKAYNENTHSNVLPSPQYTHCCI